MRHDPRARMTLRYLTTTLIALCCSLGAAAQLLNGSPTISLLTCAPGPEIYSLEGHSGLRIADADGDVVANWGLFDFDSPGFVYRFVKGETDYSVGLFPTQLFVEVYRREGRRVVEQQLNLTPEQARRVKELVMRNLSPEERVYRYNYVKDNCATRPLRLVERAVGADSITLAPALADLQPGLTFRKAMRHYHKSYPWYQFGIDLALGSGIDYELARHETAFAPVALEEMMAAAVIHTSGGDIPLVKATRVLVDAAPDAAVCPPTPFWLSPVAVFWLLAAATLLITLRDLRRGRLTARFDLIFYGLLGLTGCVLTFLIFISVHEATSPNYLYLWINPLCLFIAAAALLRRQPQWAAWLQLFNILGIAGYIGIAAFGIQAINAAFVPLMLSDIMRAAARLLTAYRGYNQNIKQ